MKRVSREIALNRWRLVLGGFSDSEIDAYLADARTRIRGLSAIQENNGTKIKPLILGGGQQKGMRSGTDNVPGAGNRCKEPELPNLNYRLKRQSLLRFVESYNYTAALILGRELKKDL